MKCAKPGSERVGEKVSGAAREKELCHCSTARKKEKYSEKFKIKKKIVLNSIFHDSSYF